MTSLRQTDRGAARTNRRDFSPLLRIGDLDYRLWMLTVFVRHILTFAIMLGIVAPMSTAALARLGAIDSRVMVICTGDALHTVRIGENGQPLEVSDDGAHCALGHAAFAGVPGRTEAPALRRLAGPEPAQVQSLATPPAPHLPSLPRAPPVA